MHYCPAVLGLTLGFGPKMVGPASTRVAPVQCMFFEQATRDSSPALFGDDSKLITVKTPTGINLEAVDDYATDSGAIIRSVEPGSNADGKGVYAGYVLMTINDEDMSFASMDKIAEAIGTEPGKVVSMRFRPHATTAEAFGWGANSMQ